MLIILLIEDSEDDFFLLRRALKAENITSTVQRVANGNQAVEYLEGNGGFANRTSFPFPDVIFTDLHMPVMDGFGVLSWLKTHPQCSLLPIMVLSSSSSHDDIERAYRLGANAYLVKPSSLDELKASVRKAHDFWKGCSVPKVNFSS